MSDFSSLASPFAVLNPFSGPAPATPTLPASTPSTGLTTKPSTGMAFPMTPGLSINSAGMVTGTPTAPAAPAAPAGGGSYAVKSGDTLSAIAQKNGMSLSQLLQLNPQFQANPNMIKPGQSVTLSAGTPTAFKTQPAPAVTLHPNIVTPSGATVNPSTGGLIAPPAGGAGNNTGAGQAPATTVPQGMSLGSPGTPATPSLPAGGGAQFFKPGPTDPGYDPSNPQAVYDSTGKILNYTDFINAGGKSDFSNVTPGGVPGANPPAGGNPAGGTPAVPNMNPGDLNSEYYTNPGYEAAGKAYSEAQKITPEEQANQQAINDLEASGATARVNTEHQPIPLEFITGQAKALEDRRLALEQPLQAKAALLQAKRTANVEATKFALDQASSKLAAFRDVNKPVTITAGTKLVNPGTGATVAEGNTKTTSHFEIIGNRKVQILTDATTGQIVGQTDVGPAPTTALNFLANNPDAASGLVSAVAGGLLNPADLNSRNMPFYTALYTTNPSFNTNQAKAAANFWTAASTQDKLAWTKSVTDNLTLLQGLSDKVTRTNSPLINKALLAGQTEVAGDPQATAFVQAASRTAAELSKVLGDSGGSDMRTQLANAVLDPAFSQQTFNTILNTERSMISNLTNAFQQQGGQTNLGTPSASGGGAGATADASGWGW